jgi:spore maturation protein CgeB
MHPRYCIGFLGADWWGSDARAVAMELRKQGHILIERNYEDYFPTKWRGPIRILRRLFRSWMQSEYNDAIRELLNVESLEFVLAFKGMLVDPSTLEAFRKRGVRCYCLYPDVSFLDHGASIWECLPVYDCVFTTKPYHICDPKLRSRVKELRLVRHGFDPAVHRPIIDDHELRKTYGCDASFVGVWSPKKEAMLQHLLQHLPGICLKIWGPAWQHASPLVRQSWQGRGAYGDEASAIYSMSKINLGLLSEAGTGSLQGDMTTARTWQIPACAGFMLHEATQELLDRFAADTEVATFSGLSEMVKKVEYYLSHPQLRDSIRLAGYARCHGEPYSYSDAVQSIISYHENQKLSI